jgi:hypothetical protein
MRTTRNVFALVVAAAVALVFGNGSLGSTPAAAHEKESHESHESGHKAHERTHHESKHDAHLDEHHGHDNHHGHHDHHGHDDHHAHDDHHHINPHDWYAHHWWHHQPSWHNHPWQHWWHRPTVNEIANWSVGLGLAAPVYYEYGPGGNVVYRDNEVYLNGTRVGSADGYSKSALALASTDVAAETSKESKGQSDWLPLGTFALLRQGADNKPSQTLQLALDKSGNVSGVLFDLPRGTSTPIQGSVERATQRVAFNLGAKSGLAAETSLYNFTGDSVPLLVHKENGKPQHYTLVRFQSPPVDSQDIVKSDK